MHSEKINYCYQLLDWLKGWKGELLDCTEDRNASLQSQLSDLESEIHFTLLQPNAIEDLQYLYELANDFYEDASRNNNFSVGTTNRNRVPIGGHKLPPLPYRYDALLPYIDEEIMRLHHTVHHKSYVDGLNKAEKELEKARNTNNYELIKHWEREAAFHGAGHYLHTIFWNVMSPHGGGEPKGSLKKQIEQDFGSFKQFKDHFSNAAKKVEGVGWAILVWAPRAGRMEILQSERHQLLSQWDVVPLMALDVWEHAYYLQYKNNKELYVDNWWNLVNWDHVQERYDDAKVLNWN